MIYLKKGIIMKTTKRILALITAFILCLAPMALMVGAAETIDVCSVCRHDSGTVISTGLEYREYVGSHNVCFNVYCDDVTSICDACGEIYFSDHVFVRSMSHPTMFYKTENGITAWHCPLCTYYQY